MACAPSETQISLGIRPVWSESSLSVWRKLGSKATRRAHCEDSDQTGRMPRLIWVFAGRTCHFVGSVMRWLILCLAKYRRQIYIASDAFITVNTLSSPTCRSELTGRPRSDAIAPLSNTWTMEKWTRSNYRASMVRRWGVRMDFYY